MSDPQGQGVARARVSVYRFGTGGQHEFAEVLSDHEGFYTAVVPENDYFVAVRHADYVIPDPRDVVLICLGSACSIFASILSRPEFDRVADRIDEVARMDLIGGQMLTELRKLLAFVDQFGWWGVGQTSELESRIRSGAD